VSDHPYRGDGGSLRCPRCGEGLLVVGLGGSSFVCAGDCGEWVGIGSLDELELGHELGHELMTDRPFAIKPIPAACPVCDRRMESRMWVNALFELCSLHGVWLDARFRAAFHMRVTAAIESEREVRELALRLSTETPEGRRELARRVIALERRMLALERRTKLLEED
jgi:hypothetical protein